MLIVAIPKSASTSLLTTLGTLYQRPATQDFFGEQVLPQGYPVVSSFHADMRLINDEQVRRWSGRDAFYKQHVIPVAANRDKLRGTKIVLLLREPKEIVLAYRRAELAKLHPERPQFADCNSEQEWLVRAEECGLLRELEAWTGAWLDDPGEKLVVHQAKLLADPGELVAAIADFWGLPRPPDAFELSRERYSRSGAARPAGARSGDCCVS